MDTNHQFLFYYYNLAYFPPKKLWIKLDYVMITKIIIYSDS